MLRSIGLFCGMVFCLLPLAAQENLSQLKLVFVGDIMGHSTQIASAAIENDKLYDYSPCFQFVAPLLEQYDMAIGNLELTLPGKPPYTGYPTFRSPDDLALALRAAGFDLLVTSNNHANDSGLTGVTNTIKTVQGYGFYQTGTFLDSASSSALYPMIIYKGNFKLAFLNYTYGTNGIPTTKPGIVNVIDEKVIKADLDVAKQLKPDAIFVVLHWGNEYQLTENETQRQLAQKILSWGCDVIIGSHPHVVQPIKQYQTVQEDGTTKNGLVVYSLGNFISGQTKIYTDIGLMVEVGLEKDLTTLKSRITGHQFMPVYRHIYRNEAGKSTYTTLPVSAFEQWDPPTLKLPESVRTAMQNSANVIRKNLLQAGSTERKLKVEELSVAEKKR